MPEHIIDRSRPTHTQSDIQIATSEGTVVLDKADPNSEIPGEQRSKRLPTEAANGAQPTSDVMVYGVYAGRSEAEYAPDTFVKTFKSKINNIPRVDQDNVGCCNTYTLINNLNSQLTHSGIISNDQSIDVRNFWRCNDLYTLKEEYEADDPRKNYDCHIMTSDLIASTSKKIGEKGSVKTDCWKIPLVKKDSCIQNGGSAGAGGDYKDCCAQKFVRIEVVEDPRWSMVPTNPFYDPLEWHTMTTFMDAIDNGHTVPIHVDTGGSKPWVSSQDSFITTKLIQLQHKIKHRQPRESRIDILREALPKASEAELDELDILFSSNVFEVNSIPTKYRQALASAATNTSSAGHAITAYGYTYDPNSGMMTVYLMNTWDDQHIAYTFHESEASKKMNFLRVINRPASQVYGFKVSACNSSDEPCNEQRSACDIPCFDCSSGSHGPPQYASVQDYTESDLRQGVSIPTGPYDFDFRYRTKLCNTSFSMPLMSARSSYGCPDLECYGCPGSKPKDGERCCTKHIISFAELSQAVKENIDKDPSAPWECSQVQDKNAKEGSEIHLKDHCGPPFQASDCEYCQADIMQLIEDFMP